MRINMHSHTSSPAEDKAYEILCKIPLSLKQMRTLRAERTADTLSTLLLSIYSGAKERKKRVQTNIGR